MAIGLSACGAQSNWKETANDAHLAAQSGDYERTRQEFEIAIQDARSSGADPVQLAPLYFEKARAEIELKQTAPAERSLDAAVEAALGGGKDNEQLIPIYKERWKLLYRQKQFARAQTDAKEVLRLQRNCCEPGSEGLLDALNLVIASACAQDRCADTSAYLKEQLDIRRAHLGKEHPHVAVSLCLLGELAEKQQHWQEAAKLYGEALDIRKRSEPGLVASTERILSRVRAHLR